MWFYLFVVVFGVGLAGSSCWESCQRVLFICFYACYWNLEHMVIFLGRYYYEGEYINLLQIDLGNTQNHVQITIMYMVVSGIGSHVSFKLSWFKWSQLFSLSFFTSVEPPACAILRYNGNTHVCIVVFILLPWSRQAYYLPDRLIPHLGKLCVI